MSAFIQWKQSHKGIRDQKSAFIAGWEAGEEDKLHWIRAFYQASEGSLNPVLLELREEAARILAE
jgi:hypothetical protein